MNVYGDPEPVYGEGARIQYRPFGGGVRTVLVDRHLAEVKNGEPGFDGVCVAHSNLDADPIREHHTGEHGVWGYDSQIIRVLEPGDGEMLEEDWS